MKAEKHKGQTGWVIRDGDGKMLREFVDTNGDNIVDRWSCGPKAASRSMPTSIHEISAARRPSIAG